MKNAALSLSGSDLSPGPNLYVYFLGTDVPESWFCVFCDGPLVLGTLMLRAVVVS